MNINYCLLFLMTIITTHSYSQVKNSTQNNMRKFDIPAFREKEKNENNKYIFESNDTITSLEDWGNIYVERLVRKGTNRVTQYEYSRKGNLILYKELYCSVPVGIRKWYSEEGTLVKEKDEDAPYAFSMEDLREVIKKIFKLDILDKKRGLRIQRYENEPLVDNNGKPIVNLYPNSKYLYEVAVPLKEMYLVQVCDLIFDGTTGEILWYASPEENVTQAIENYKKQKNNTSTSKAEKRDWTPLID